MPDYIQFPIESDEEALAHEAFDYLQTVIPGWEPSPAHFEAWLLEAVALAASEMREVASDVPTTIFRYFGARLVGVEPVDATPSTATTTWTVKDTQGYTIPDGTVVGVRAAGDVLVAFETVGDVTIGTGSLSTPVGGVNIVSMEEGAHTAGLGAAGSAVELVDSLEYVTGITMVAATAGGTDAEEDADYLNRLSARLTLLADRPILARDFAVLAQQVAGVDRALAIDNFIPPSTTNAERAVAVATHDVNGAANTATVKAAVDALLQARREVNFIVNVIDPTYTVVNVVYTARCYSDFSPTDVQARINTAVLDYLNPRDWGQPRYGDKRVWVNTPVVRRNELISVIDNVEGVSYVETVTINGAATDLTLTGNAPLPSATSTATGTVTVE